MNSTDQSESGEQFRLNKPLVSSPNHLMLKKSQCWLCAICYELFVVNNLLYSGFSGIFSKHFLLWLLQCSIPHPANNALFSSMYWLHCG